MVTRPDSIDLTDEQRRAVAAYMGVKGLAKRRDVKRMVNVLWSMFLEDAQANADSWEEARRRAAPVTR